MYTIPGNSYGCNETHCDMGLGPQEQFINCADIAILPDCDSMSKFSHYCFIIIQNRTNFSYVYVNSNHCNLNMYG